MNTTVTRTARALACLLFASLALSAAPAEAKPVRTPGRFGLGIGSGTMANGLSAKYFAAKEHALQFNLGVFGGGGIDNRWRRFGGLGLSADYLFEMPTLVKAGQAFELAWNVGAGIGIGLDDDDRGDDFFALAASFVLGLEFNFIPVPIDIVLEYRPGLLLTPDVDFDAVDFTGHIRFYF